MTDQLARTVLGGLAIAGAVVLGASDALPSEAVVGIIALVLPSPLGTVRHRGGVASPPLDAAPSRDGSSQAGP